MSLVHIAFYVCASIVSVLVTCYLALLYFFRRHYAMLGHLPSLPKFPILGNTHLVLWGDAENFFNRFKELGLIMNEKQSPGVFFFGPLPVIFVSQPEDVKVISNAYVEKTYFYSFASNLLGQGLISAKGSVWKHTFKKLSAVYTPAVLDRYQDMFNAHAENLVVSLKKEAGGEAFDVWKKYLAPTSLKAIWSSALGIPTSSEYTLTNNIFYAINETMKLITKRGINIFVHPTLIYQLTSTYRAQTKLENYINGELEKAINKRKLERIEMKKIEELGGEPEKESIRSYLDLLLELGESNPSVFSARQIRDEMNTIIAAGYETVGFALMVCMLTVGSYPEVQTKLYDEIKEIFGESNRAVTKEDLTRMRYCDAIINEVNRLYPAVGLIGRTADHDVQLKNCTVPKGTTCGILVWATHRCKETWGDDADIFRPERWFEFKEKTPFCLPFGYGKRLCIGKRYASSFLKTVLAYLVRELEFEADVSKLRLAFNITTVPVAGHDIALKSRRDVSPTQRE